MEVPVNVLVMRRLREAPRFDKKKATRGVAFSRAERAGL
jgi:hypothetical protein